MTITAQTFPWRPAAWLNVQGEDAFTFLQGQFTNDLRRLESDPAVYGLWLNQKGKVVADSFILKGALKNSWWIGSYFSSAAVVRERLESYIIADDVTISDETDSWYGLTVRDATAPAEVGSGELVFPARRGWSQAWEWMAREPRAILGARSLTTSEMELTRIAAGVPAVPADLGLSELPNEGGLDAFAISYTKGCYLGQEVMARLKNLGQVRRQLRGVKGDGAAPPRQTPIYQNGKKVGELRSSVTEGACFRGIALVTTMQLDEAARLSLAPEGPGLIEWAPFA